MVLDESATAFHPIPTVTVDDVVQPCNFGAMNVTAYDPVDTKAGRLIGNRLLEVADELNGIFDFMF